LDSATVPETGELKIAQARGGTGEILAGNVAYVVGWSPDGRLFAFVDGSDRLAVVDVATAKVRKLAALGGLWGTTWSPDSRRLLLFDSVDAHCNALWQVPADGSRARLVSSCY